MAKERSAISSSLLILSNTHPSSQGHCPDEVLPPQGARADHGAAAGGPWDCLQSMSDRQRELRVLEAQKVTSSSLPTTLFFTLLDSHGLAQTRTGLSWFAQLTSAGQVRHCMLQQGRYHHLEICQLWRVLNSGKLDSSSSESQPRYKDMPCTRHSSL